jgi:hypothetical protein
MSRSRAAGTRWETAIVTALREHGWLHAERRAMNGNHDRGDITGIPGLVIEAKNVRRVELAQWVDEALAERANDGADVAVVWVKRRGRTSAADAFVVMDGDTFMRLLTQAGY